MVFLGIYNVVGECALATNGGRPSGGANGAFGVHIQPVAATAGAITRRDAADLCGGFGPYPLFEAAARSTEGCDPSIVIKQLEFHGGVVPAKAHFWSLRCAKC